MVEPYYRDGLATLFVGDCRTITEWRSADVLVMDPPYGRSWCQGSLHRPKDARPTIAGDLDTTLRDDALALWGADRLAVVFGDLMLPAPIGCKQVLVYRKPPNAGTRGAIAGRRRDLEAVYLLGPWPAGLGGRSSLLTTLARSQGNPSSAQGKYGHPHAKPVDVMTELIELTSAGVVADPFAGSGSTLVAAKLIGRSVVGVELEAAHCATAARRLAQDGLPFEEVS